MPCAYQTAASRAHVGRGAVHHHYTITQAHSTMTIISEWLEDYSAARRTAAITARLLRRQLQEQVRHGERPAVLLHWCALQPPAIAVPSAVAACTLLRRKDVRRLHIHDWFQGKATSVTQSKTGHPVDLPPIRCQFKAEELAGAAVYAVDHMSARTADRMRTRAWNAVGVRTHHARKTCLHMVRHVYATWAAWCGQSMEEIGDVLGHGTAEATATYIHSINHLFTEEARKGL